MSKKMPIQDYLSVFGKHSDLFIQAYEASPNRVAETPANSKQISELRSYSIMAKGDSEGGARLESRHLQCANMALKPNRLRISNPNIAGIVGDINDDANEYLRSKRDGNDGDAYEFLKNLEANVHQLCDELTGQSDDIWRQITSRFGALSSVKAKIAFNNRVLTKVNGVIRTLEHIDLENLLSLGSNDRELRGLLSVQLPNAITASRATLGDASVRLSNNIFDLNRLASRAKLVNRLIRHYNKNSSFKPEDYTSRLDVPPLFSIGQPITATAAPDVNNPDMEFIFSDLLVNLRNESVPDEAQEVVRIKVRDEPSDDVKVLPLDPITVGIKATFLDCFKKCLPICGRDAYTHFAPEGTPLDIWLYGLIAEHNAMPESKRRHFDLGYTGEKDPVFGGNFLATEVIVSRR